jgi:orotate phosphoribosyltransferase
MTWIDEKEQAAREILKLLYEYRLIRTFYRDRPQGWTLVSGLYSPLYVQLRPLASFPEVFARTCQAISKMVREEAPEITKVVGIAMAGVPIAAGMSVVGKIPAGFTRKMDNVKTIEELRRAVTAYGEHALVEGELSQGDRIALVDDLVTRFDSKEIAREQVKYEVQRRGISDVTCDTVAVVLDREQGGAEASSKLGIRLLSLIPFKSVGLPLLKPVMHEAEWEILRDYLENPEEFQDRSVQERVARRAAK